MRSTTLQEWKTTGDYIKVGPCKHQVFVKQIGKADAAPEQTLLLLHGFPESSFSFHAVVNGLAKRFERILLFDMIGYGWSDKPTDNYSYSLLEQADIALQVWQHFGVKGGHLLAHDVGDSVATELLARQVNDLLPGWFDAGFQTLTFTNGGMVLDLAELRIIQKILLSRYGHWLRHFALKSIFKHQVKSAHGNDKLSEAAIESLWAGNQLQDGHRKNHLTIKYLNDRKQFEKTRWLPALSQVKIPIHLCWGNADAVAKIEMAHYLKKHICPQAQLTVMEGVGHFCQLGSPNIWTRSVNQFYDKL